MRLTNLLLSMLLLLFIASNSVTAQTESNIDGLLFADYYYNYQNSVAAEKDRNAFQFRRIYFTL